MYKKSNNKKKSESFIYNQIRQKHTESDCELRLALYKSDDDHHQYNVQSTPRWFCDNDFFLKQNKYDRIVPFPACSFKDTTK